MNGAGDAGASRARVRSDPRSSAHEPRTPGARSGLTVGAVVAALVATRGQKTLAAERLGCSYNTLRRFELRNPGVSEAIKEQNERRVDLAVLELDKLMLAGYWPAIRFILERLGAARGFAPVTRIEGSLENGNGGTPLRRVRFVDAPTREEVETSR